VELEGGVDLSGAHAAIATDAFDARLARLRTALGEAVA
jgi:hypothetical protein